ncbi:MAG: hypothetical protein EOP49_36635, partial [Sphingobacteriales bacterium]
MTWKIILPLAIVCCCISCKKNDRVKVQQYSYVLPGDQFFPEGIAYDRSTGVFYTGSTTSGDIVAVDVETGVASLFSSGAKAGRQAAIGMKLDAMDRLWVCGGTANFIQVLDKDGNVIKTWDTKALFNSGFVNDCIIVNGYIYFTDSQVRKIYRTRVTETLPGEMEEWLSFTDQQIPYGTGINANGIEATPDGKQLLVVISNSGKLYRVNIADKGISEIALNTPVTSGDGLLTDGNTLYISRNATGLIFPVTLNAGYSSGYVGAGFGENLIGNTTITRDATHAPARRATQDPKWVRYVILAFGLTFLTVFLFVPLVAIFIEALRGGLGAYFNALREPNA